MYFHIINGRPVSLVTKSVKINGKKTQQGYYISARQWCLSMSRSESPASFVKKGGQPVAGAVLSLLHQTDVALIKRLGRGLGRE